MGKALTIIAGGILLMIGFILLIVKSADFAPDGVPLSRRAEYEQKVAAIKLREQSHNTGLQQSEKGMPVAKAVVDEDHFDFGLLDPHTTTSHSFVIRNEGTADLFIESAGTSCKCTVSAVNDGAIKPGKESEVIVTWNTGYQSEEYEQTALVLTNDLTRREIELKVSGQVRAELVVGALDLSMPAVDAGELSEASTFLYSQLWDDFRIDSATSDLPGFQWSAEPLGVDELPEGDLEARSAWKLKLVAVGVETGDFKGQVKLVVVPTSGGSSVERELNVKGRVRSSIAFVDPELVEKGLNLGIIRRGQEFSRSIIVRVRDQPNRILAVLDVKPKELSAKLEETKVPGAYRLSVIVPADSNSVMFDRDDQHGYVHVGDAADRNFQNWLPLFGSIVNPPSNE